MTVLKIFIVVVALLFCPSLGAGYNCTRRYQRLLREVAVVKAQCPNAAFHDCCQVRVCFIVTSVLLRNYEISIHCVILILL